MNVFELAGQYLDLQHKVERGDITMDDALAAMEVLDDQFENKIENLAFVLRNQQAVLDGQKKAKADLEERIVVSENAIKRVQRMINDLMTVRQVSKVPCRYFTVAKRRASNPSMKIEDESKIPAEYFVTITPEPVRELDSARLKEDLKDGLAIDGVRLEYSSFIQIK